MKNFLFLSIISTFFLLHLENARIAPFGVPIYLVEIGVLTSAVFLSAWKREGKILQGVKRTKEKKEGEVTQGEKSGWTAPRAFGVPRAPWPGILFLLLGIMSSIVIARSGYAVCPLSREGFLHALGILKSWFFFPILFGWILSRVSEEYISRNKLLFGFLISFLPIGILSSLGWIFGSDMTYDDRLRGVFNSPNALSLHLTPALILSWYFVRSHTLRTFHSSRFVFYSLTFTLICTLLFFTRSVSAWIAVSIAVLLFEIMRHQHAPKKIFAFSGLFLFFAAALLFSQWENPRFEHFFNPDARSSFASRLMIWRSTEKMLIDSPIFGIGPGNFQSCYLSYQQYFPPYLEWSVPEPHNLFLAFWLGGGLIGLLAFLFLMTWWFRTVAKGIQKRRDSSTLLVFAAIMIALLIHGLFDTPYWRLGLSYIFWIVFFLGISWKNRRGGKA